jgi:DNA-binding transcriptional regulator YhcF (GntR family)
MEKLPLQLSQASGVPFYRQIVDQLAGLIRSGQLPPNTRLPSFRELAPQLLVSLITVRRAYADLEAAGLIVSRHGQGTFVAGEIEAASRRQALAEARALVESALVRARQLGLRGEALRAHVDRLIGREDDAAGAGARTEKGRAHGRD